MINTYTWARGDGWTFVVAFANGNGAEFVQKLFKTKHGAQKAADRFVELMDNWKDDNLQYNITNMETGEVTNVFKFINGQQQVK
jgi:hypothetical protein